MYVSSNVGVTQTKETLGVGEREEKKSRLRTTFEEEEKENRITK